MGDYEVTVTDSNGCTEVTNITVTNNCVACNGPDIAVINITEENCSMSNGSVEITLQQDVNNFDFEWSAPIPSTNNTNIANNILAGTYTVTITDKNNPNCFLVETVQVQSIDGLVVDIFTTAADCGLDNGYAKLEPAIYEYEWGTMPTIKTDERSDLAPGTYMVTATLNGDCATEYEVVIGGDSNCIKPDTLYFETPMNTQLDSICIDLSDFGGQPTQTLPCANPSNGTMIISTFDSCMVYIPDTDYIGLDTTCVVALSLIHI